MELEEIDLEDFVDGSDIEPGVYLVEDCGVWVLLNHDFTMYDLPINKFYGGTVDRVFGPIQKVPK